MVQTLMIFQAVISGILILLVLIQFGKGAEAGIFSGSSDGTFTGIQQGNILSKTTIVISILFMANSVFLARIQGKESKKSIFDNEAPIVRPLNDDPNPVKEKKFKDKKSIKKKK